jgi:DNA-binding transcriptional LysR family regulator
VRSLKAKLADRLPDLSFQLTASNVHDAVLYFTDGASDFLVCYHHSREPIELDPSKFEVRVLGTERFAPYSAAKADGSPIYSLDPLAPLPVPYLSYSKHAYLSKMTDIAMESGPLFLKKSLFETDMSESLKSMCEAGLGVAWLPESAVATGSGLCKIPGPYFTDMEVRLYRRTHRPTENSVAHEQVDLIWHYWPD